MFLSLSLSSEDYYFWYYFCYKYYWGFWIWFFVEARTELSDWVIASFRKESKLFRELTVMSCIKHFVVKQRERQTGVAVFHTWQRLLTPFPWLVTGVRCGHWAPTQHYLISLWVNKRIILFRRTRHVLLIFF